MEKRSFSKTFAISKRTTSQRGNSFTRKIYKIYPDFRYHSNHNMITSMEKRSFSMTIAIGKRPHLNAASLLIHCGDLCSPFIIKQLGEGVTEIPVHIVWGNNDGDKRLLSKLAAQFDNIHIHGVFVELDLEAGKVAVTHYPEIGRALAKSSQYDLVCYGHDHTAHEEKIGDTLLLNPGEIMGLNGRRTLAICTLPDKIVEWVEIE